MTIRATKRGSQRTPLSAECDVLICGASFAGLSVARELAGIGARVMVIDRYEIGERQTSACAAPTAWLENLGLGQSILQTFGELVVHTPDQSVRWELPFTFSTFDYRQLCLLLWDQAGDAHFETAKVNRRSGSTVETDRGAITSELIVDAMGWRRILDSQPNVQPPDAPMSRGLEVSPAGSREDLELWLDPSYLASGYGWSFPAGGEVRVGLGSFEPRDHVREPTVRLSNALGLAPDKYQGNWIPHKLRPGAGDEIFYVGDSAGHCLPLSAEGIRTAFYFGLAAGRELRLILEGGQGREQALERYALFSAQHAAKFSIMLGLQQAYPKIPTRLMSKAVRAFGNPKVSRWAFQRYLEIAPPSYALSGPARSEKSPASSAAA
ncbi:MAG: FAD-dependent monooxygenase [Actinomycetota bacterium]